MQEIIEKIITKKKLLLSTDLDDTLIIRKKGDNYVSEQTKRLLEDLHKHPDIYLVPNTGRELVGFASFQKQVINLQNGILGSGAILLCDGKKIFNKETQIPSDTVRLFIEAIQNDIIPFVDFSHSEGRLIVANKQAQKNLHDLMFSQTPDSWFDGKMPPIISPEAFQNSSLEVFRIEFPVNKVHEMLFDELSKKSPHAFTEFTKLLGVNPKMEIGYSLKRKAYFKEVYKKDLVFARFEKSLETMNKGIGIKLWMEHMNIDPKDTSIIHIGDQDSGIVNDAIIKQELPEAQLIMVGKDCKQNNPSVDLYACEGETEDEVRMVLEKILRNTQLSNFNSSKELFLF
jgi:hydroxymethylpyrimidine pyrophosphatase-like HAD family hydrolase